MSEKLYDQDRCLLVHNTTMKDGIVLAVGEASDPSFHFGADGNVQWINLVPLFDIVSDADSVPAEQVVPLEEIEGFI